MVCERLASRIEQSSEVRLIQSPGILTGLFVLKEKESGGMLASRLEKH